MKNKPSNNDLFLHQLQDMYYVEKQLVKALPKMAENSISKELSNGFKKHLMETEKQVERLERVFEIFGLSPKAKKCEAMDGLIAEAKELMSEFEGTPFSDAALIAGAQKIEHYEIASYGCLYTWANMLGMHDVSALFKETLQEEKHADEALTRVAESQVNAHAFAGV